MATTACSHTGFSPDCSKHQVQQHSERILVYVGSPLQPAYTPTSPGSCQWGVLDIILSIEQLSVERDPWGPDLAWGQIPPSLPGSPPAGLGQTRICGVKQGACFLCAVPAVGKVQPGLGAAGKQDKVSPSEAPSWGQGGGETASRGPLAQAAPRSPIIHEAGGSHRRKGHPEGHMEPLEPEAGMNRGCDHSPPHRLLYPKPRQL